MTTTHTPTTGLRLTSRSLALLMAGALMCSASFAEKPEWAGGGKNKEKGGKHSQVEQSDQDDHGGKKDKKSKGKKHEDVRVGGYFVPEQRVVLQDYYGKQFKSGHCPPGLAKKNNGCMPPGQAKKYAIGQPLPAGVVYYPVPASVVVRLGPPPSGHKYVRVATDILLIALGTSMVVDAVQDLGSL
jgi:hypothetical protein